METIKRPFETFCKNDRIWKGEISRFGRSDILLRRFSGHLAIVVCSLTTSVLVTTCYYHVFKKFRCISTRFFQLKTTHTRWRKHPSSIKSLTPTNTHMWYHQRPSTSYRSLRTQKHTLSHVELWPTLTLLSHEDEYWNWRYVSNLNLD